ncbi:MAG TPA: GtrA family protein [Acidimicrobiales bacterium]
MGSLLRAAKRAPLVDRVLAIPLVDRLVSSRLVQKLVKYSAASAAGVLVGQATLVFCLEVLDWPALGANLASVTLGCVPNYTINRYWTWQQTGQNRLWGEVIPFWFMAAAGALLSMLAVAFADHQWGTTLAVAIANLAGFGVLWIAKFLVLDKIMWRVVHDLHPEVEVPPEMADELGVDVADATTDATAGAAPATTAADTNGSADASGNGTGAPAAGTGGTGSALGGAVAEQVGQSTPPR